MPLKLLWSLIVFCPAIVVSLLGLRAKRSQNDAAWIDYFEASTVLDWFFAPLALVAIPLVAKQPGFNIQSSMWIIITAIIVFPIVSCVFMSEEKFSFSVFASRLAVISARTLVICAYITWFALKGTSHSLFPSAWLFMSTLVATYIGQLAWTALLRSVVKRELLAPCELLDRIHSIAEQRGANVKRVFVVRSVPGCSDLVNAQAGGDSEIVIGAGLVARFDKDEVDAVIEHEVGHLADDRINTVEMAIRLGCLIVFLTLIFLAETHIGAFPTRFAWLLYVIWAALFILPELFSKWYFRSIEQRANENKHNPSNPLAAISTYYKLNLFHHLPVSRPLWSRLISTHPCTDEIVATIAQKAGLSNEQLKQVYERAATDILSPTGDRYELLTKEEAKVDGECNTHYSETGLIKRPGYFPGFRVALICVAVLVGFVYGCGSLIMYMLHRTSEWLVLVMSMVFVIGCGFVLFFPAWYVRCARRQRLREQIRHALVAKYGESAESQSILVDARFPDGMDEKGLWQGAILEFVNGQIVVRGEISKLSIPLGSRISISRRVNKSGWDDTQMVMIGYRSKNAFHSVMARVLGDPEKGEPANWRQLERRIKSMMADTGIEVVPLYDIWTEGAHRLTWSYRVPVAVVIFAAILALTVWLIDLMGAENWVGNLVSYAVFFVSGSLLWEWVTKVPKPKDS